MNDMSKTITASDMGKKGGRVTKARYGIEHYRRLGRLGGRPRTKTANEEIKQTTS